MNRWFVGYEDEGPLGAGAQCMSRTSRWRVLYEYDNEEDARNFYTYLKSLSADRDLGRRAPRATGIWADDPVWGRIEPGPIMRPEDYRR